MNFCPECGSRVQPEAKFCVGCGQPLTSAATVQPREPFRLPGGFAVVFGGLIVIGLGAAFFLFHQYRATQAKEQTAQTRNASNLPPGHPQIQLPAQAREFIADLQAKAKKQPKDVAIWDRLGIVALRASMFDPSYFPMASEAYGHVLQLDPENLDALRGIGNLDYDQQKYDEAIAAYEHYLKHKPDDPDVQTDLGTMYLYTGNPDQAIRRYKKAISIKPDAFEAYFNMGVAYAAMNNNALAHQALDQAMKYAPDKDAKGRVKDLLAKLEGKGGQTEVASADSTGGVEPPASTAPAAAPNTFQGQIEAMVRGLPFAGPKVQAVKWPSKTKAIVLMNNFPMNEMPPFARQKFLSDLSAGIAQAKETYHIQGPFELQIADAASGQVMDTVDSKGGGAPAASSAPAAAPNTFQGQIEAMVRGLPFAGPKVQAVKWPSKAKAVVLMNNFPMDEMPPFARQKFLSDLSAGIAQAKETYHIRGPFELQIADAASGQVMDTVSK